MRVHYEVVAVMKSVGIVYEVRIGGTRVLSSRDEAVAYFSAEQMQNEAYQHEREQYNIPAWGA